MSLPSKKRVVKATTTNLALLSFFFCSPKQRVSIQLFADYVQLSLMPKGIKIPENKTRKRYTRPEEKANQTEMTTQKRKSWKSERKGLPKTNTNHFVLGSVVLFYLFIYFFKVILSVNERLKESCFLGILKHRRLYTSSCYSEWMEN